MKDAPFTIQSACALAEGVFELRLEGDASDFARPGQFANLSVPGFYLRRPVSVCDWTPSSLVLLIREVGAGTAWLRAAAPGTTLSVLTGLGNGFDLAAAPDGAFLVGGGIGIAPLYGLARRMAEAGRAPVAVLGFRNAEGAFYLDEFRALGCEVVVATEDGSLGRRGLVTEALRTRPGLRHAFACGPAPMLRAVARLPQVADGQFSLEARMGCGFGACVGCTVQTAHGPARVCIEGPVFRKGELAW